MTPLLSYSNFGRLSGAGFMGAGLVGTLGIKGASLFAQGVSIGAGAFKEGVGIAFSGAREGRQRLIQAQSVFQGEKGVLSEFLARGPVGHVAKGFKNVGLGLSPGFLALDLGISSYLAFADTSDREFLGARNGVVRNFGANLAAGPGSLIGGGIGAGIGTALLGIAGGPVGFLAGTILGGGIASELADVPFKLADYGHGLRKRTQSPFVDSYRAATMRQQAMDIIYQSQFNVRSALGREASVYHM